jgi:hypothetical protein
VGGNPSGIETIAFSAASATSIYDKKSNPSDPSFLSSILILNDKKAPTAAITYDPAGPYKNGAEVTITAIFNEPMGTSPLAKIALSGANTLVATNMTQWDEVRYSYTHTVSSGDGSVTVALSIGEDVGGNVLDSVPSSGANFNVDNTPPTKQLFTPLDDAVDIGIKDELEGLHISLENADDEIRGELEGQVQELVDIEKRLEACRVATMGRLSELGLIKWKIGPNTSSEYTIVESV